MRPGLVQLGALAVPLMAGCGSDAPDCAEFCRDNAIRCGGVPEQCEAECDCWAARWRPSAFSSVVTCLGEPRQCGFDDYTSCVAAAASGQPRPDGLDAYLGVCESSPCSFDSDACEGEFLRLYPEGTVAALDECLARSCEEASDCVDAVLFCPEGQ